MNVLRLLSAATLLVACLASADVTASPQDDTLVTEEAFEGLPLTAPLEPLTALEIDEQAPAVDEETSEPASMIPEPAGIALIGGGLLAMIVMRRRLG